MAPPVPLLASRAATDDIAGRSDASSLHFDHRSRCNHGQFSFFRGGYTDTCARFRNRNQRTHYFRSHLTRTGPGGRPKLESTCQHPVCGQEGNNRDCNVHHGRSGEIPCRSGPGSLHGIDEEQERQHRTLWTVRGRCGCGQNDEGELAMRYGDTIRHVALVSLPIFS
jgi:hypothetical protein